MRSRRSYHSPIHRLELIFKLIMRDGYRCGICGELLPSDSWDDIHIDHIIPWKLSRDSSFSNLRNTHKTCNLRAAHNPKGYRGYTPEQREIGRLKGLRTIRSRAVERALKVHTLRARGLTFSDISKLLGCSLRTVQGDAKRSFDELSRLVHCKL